MFAKNETETSVKVLMLTPQNFKGMFYSNKYMFCNNKAMFHSNKSMFYSNEQALNSKMWLNVGVNSKSLLYSKH
jgi:hypothetical protein